MPVTKSKVGEEIWSFVKMGGASLTSLYVFYQMLGIGFVTQTQFAALSTRVTVTETMLHIKASKSDTDSKVAGIYARLASRDATLVKRNHSEETP